MQRDSNTQWPETLIESAQKEHKTMRFLELFVSCILAQSIQIVQSMGTWDRVKESVHLVSGILGGWDQNRATPAAGGRGLQIIGAGFPRTGTKSIEAALRILGHNIYDIRSIAKHRHGGMLVEAYRDYKISNDTAKLEQFVLNIEALGYTATLDAPMAHIALALAELRPDAKVLLSVRDSAAAWIASYAFIEMKGAYMLSCKPWKHLLPDISFVRDIIELQFGKSVEATPVKGLTLKPGVFPWYDTIEIGNGALFGDSMAEWEEAYILHQEQVADAMTADRLLIFNVKEGWGPWLDFMKVPKPDTTFPYINDRSTLTMLFSSMEILAMSYPFIILLVLWLLTSSISRSVRRWLGGPPPWFNVGRIPVKED